MIDPRNRRSEVGDVCLRDGRVVDALPAAAPVLEARHLVVMPGGVDLHTHVAGPSVAAARLLCPEDGGRTLPTLAETGRLYARMGYTTIVEAAVAPLGARAAHADLDAIPIVDKALLVLLGNNEIALGFLAEGRPDALREYVAWVLEAARAFGVKAASPGGVEAWKCGLHDRGGTQPADASGAAAPAAPLETILDAPGPAPGLTPRRIVQALAGAVRDLGLPHPLHLHMNGLGVPGNAAVALATFEALAGLPAHVTHLQYHAYGGRTPAGLRSRAAEITAWINAHPGLTCDAGQVVFGPATTISADAAAQHRLHRATGRKWLNLDIEVESGCGIVPHAYRESHLVSAVQWAIGLEILLGIEDPWRVVLTTDHPNGGPFTSYPHIIRLLMDKPFRDGILARSHARLKERTGLQGLSRQYSLEEIAVITRAAPARLLGLESKGHLGPGADADLVLYDPSADPERMFANPIAVIKDGEPVAREGEILRETPGRTLRAAPPRAGGRARTAFEKEIRDQFEAYYTVPFEDYPVPEGAVRREQVVAARPVAR